MRLRHLTSALLASALLAGPALAVDYKKGPTVDPAAGAPRKDDSVAPDVELFFKNPKFGGVTLSPDGKFAVALVGAKESGRRNLMLVDLADPKKSRFLTNLKETDIQGFFWKGNDRVVFTLDSDGNESLGVYSVDTGEKPLIRVLIDAKKLESGRSAQIIDTLENSPDEVLIQLNLRDARYPDAIRLNVVNSKQTLAARNEGDITGWFADRNGVIRGAIRVHGRDEEVLYRGTAEAPGRRCPRPLSRKRAGSRWRWTTTTARCTSAPMSATTRRRSTSTTPRPRRGASSSTRMKPSMPAA
jgi:hypothetical protein